MRIIFWADTEFGCREVSRKQAERIFGKDFVEEKTEETVHYCRVFGGWNSELVQKPGVGYLTIEAKQSNGFLI